MTQRSIPTAPQGATDDDDHQLIGRVLAGDTAAFEPLMRRYNERVYRVARSIVRDESEAEDVMQQAYVNAYVHLRQFRGAARFSTWLTRIVINEALARVRRPADAALDENHPNVVPFMTGPPAENPEREAFRGELRLLLEWAIDGLPDGMREVFVLREVEGLSTAETAESLDVSEDVVKTRLSRGRAQLRLRLLQRTGAAAAGAFRFHRPRCDRIVAQVLGRVADDTVRHDVPPALPADAVVLTADQLVALRRELHAALDGLDALDHLCSVQQLAGRVEEGVSSALYILGRAQALAQRRDPDGNDHS